MGKSPPFSEPWLPPLYNTGIRLKSFGGLEARIKAVASGRELGAEKVTEEPGRGAKAGWHNQRNILATPTHRLPEAPRKEE